MKTLDVNNYGVQEMNAGEMRENNGGMDIGGWLTVAEYMYKAGKIWVREQSRVLDQLGSDAQNAAVQYN